MTQPEQVLQEMKNLRLALEENTKAHARNSQLLAEFYGAIMAIGRRSGQAAQAGLLIRGLADWLKRRA